MALPKPIALEPEYKRVLDWTWLLGRKAQLTRKRNHKRPKFVRSLIDADIN